MLSLHAGGAEMGQRVMFESTAQWRGNTPSVLSKAKGRAVMVKPQARLEHWLVWQEPGHFL